ncbi:unnamed protein product [Prorocentrum cordatum]|uniref:Ras-related protein Rab-14 n=1 Tax=Prorocentrum cordatum TaxID=2364126 RepID=A0ABN9STZ1_9DINO|nr:unnamed protein product [Polarella glacialis]
MAMAYDYCFKFIIIGDSCCGKSCLLFRFVEDKFDESKQCTIGVEFGARIITIDKTQIKLQTWDTAGQEEFRSITRSYYRGACGALLVYDVTKRATFERIRNWFQEVQQYANEHIAITLVGNKCDLEPWEVSFEEGAAFAKEHGIAFHQTSAKTSLNVDEAFLQTARTVFGKVRSNVYDLSVSDSCGIKVCRPARPAAHSRGCCKS